MNIIYMLRIWNQLKLLPLQMMDQLPQLMAHSIGYMKKSLAVGMDFDGVPTAKVLLSGSLMLLVFVTST